MLDSILNAGDDKLLSKLYEYLLALYMVDEQIKDLMILWAWNVGYQIPLLTLSVENY